MQTIIREAEASDAEQLFGLASQLAISTKVNLDAFGVTFDELLKTDHARLFVAVRGEILVGYVLGSHRLCFYANGNVAWVEELFVDEACRGQGVGGELMECFEIWARKKQCSGVALATRRSAPFYEAIGYEDSAKYLKKKLSDEDSTG